MYSFALFFEVAIAVCILSMAGYAYATVMYANSIANTNAINHYNSIYDLFIAVKYNATYSLCISNSDYACIMRELKDFASVYKLSFISLYADNLSVSYGNQGLCSYRTEFCLPIGIKGGFYPMCATVCSD